MEDNPADIFLIRRALEGANIQAELRVVKDGEQALRFLGELDGDIALPSPDIILLDINLPKKHGGEVLQHIRASSRCANAIVIAVSGSNSATDRANMLSLGANAYFRKPSEHDEFMKLGDMVKKILEG